MPSNLLQRTRHSRRRHAVRGTSSRRFDSIPYYDARQAALRELGANAQPLLTEAYIREIVERHMRAAHPHIRRARLKAIVRGVYRLIHGSNWTPHEPRPADPAHRAIQRQRAAIAAWQRTTQAEGRYDAYLAYMQAGHTAPATAAFFGVSIRTVRRAAAWGRQWGDTTTASTRHMQGDAPRPEADLPCGSSMQEQAGTLPALRPPPARPPAPLPVPRIGPFPPLPRSIAADDPPPPAPPSPSREWAALASALASRMPPRSGFAPETVAALDRGADRMRQREAQKRWWAGRRPRRMA